MPPSQTPIVLTPTEYELAVKAILDASGPELRSYESWHLHKVQGVYGEYVIDVVVTFEALGAVFRVLVECKHEKRKVERQDVQVLKTKLDSTGAQKGMVFSIAGFQEGAIKFADTHGIALVMMVTGASTWLTRSFGPSLPPPEWVETPEYVGWWCHGNNQSLVSPDYNEHTRQLLGLEGAA